MLSSRRKSALVACLDIKFNERFTLCSGVKSIDKREGGGSHNWGTFEDDIKADDDKANTSTDEVLNEPAAATGTSIVFVSFLGSVS